MMAATKRYLVASLILAVGLTAFVYEAINVPLRHARWRRKQGDLAELARLGESSAAQQAAIRAFEQLPYRVPRSLTQLLQSFPDLNGALRTEPEQPFYPGGTRIPWSLVRGTLTFENVPFDRIWSFIERAGSAQDRPPWRVAEIQWAPSAQGHGQVIVTLEALRAGDASSPATNATRKDVP